MTSTFSATMSLFDEDPFMLVRAMVLTEFRCPPLPIVGQQISGDNAIINSHDLMATFMAQSFRLSDESKNSVRRQIQEVVRERYIRELSELQHTPFERIYEIMSRYTCEYMGTYLLGTPFSANDLRVLPYDYVTPQLAKEVDHYGRALQIMVDDLLNKTVDRGETANGGLIVDYHCQNVVKLLLMRCARCAVEYKEQGVIHEPVLKRVRRDVCAE
jgi:hypothetical protein